MSQLSEQVTRWCNSYQNDFQGDNKKFLPNPRSISPADIFALKYRQLRKCDTDTYKDYSHDSDIIDISAQESDTIKATSVEGWHTRSARTLPETASNFPYRISLNVRGTRKLIEDLDAFCSDHQIHYKCPTNIAGWNTRHDPITIYFTTPVTDAQKSRIVEIALPFVRGHNLVGEELATGVSLCPEVTSEKQNALKNRAKALDPDLEFGITAFMATNYTDLLSAGALQAVENALNEFEQFRATEASSRISQTNTSNPDSPIR